MRRLECDHCENQLPWYDDYSWPTFCPDCGNPWHSRLAVPKRLAPGKFYPEVLEQDTYWVNAKGEVLRIEEMDGSHIANCVAMLLREPGRFRSMYSRHPDTTRRMRLHRNLGVPAADWVTARSPYNQQDAAWISRSPLVQRMFQELSINNR